MKVYICPKCCNKMEDIAPNFCPNCGCESKRFILTEVDEAEKKQPKPAKINQKEPKKKGCSFFGCLGIGILVAVVGFVILLLVDSGSSSGNNTSTPTMSRANKEILAKNCFVDNCIKKNMHDPKSYKEEDYNVYYANGEYIVTVMFRGNNAYGKSVVSTYKGAVKFTDDDRYQCRIISQ